MYNFHLKSQQKTKKRGGERETETETERESPLCFFFCFVGVVGGCSVHFWHLFEMYNFHWKSQQKTKKRERERETETETERESPLCFFLFCWSGGGVFCAFLAFV